MYSADDSSSAASLQKRGQHMQDFIMTYLYFSVCLLYCY